MESELELLLNGRPFKKLSQQLYADLMATTDLRKVELDILYFIAHAGIHDTARDIMYCRQLSKAHISKCVENLKDRGYIYLLEDDEDRRRYHIRITDDAYPILKQLEAIKKTVLGVLFNDVTEEERRTLAQVARKMAQNLNRAVE